MALVPVITIKEVSRVKGVIVMSSNLKVNDGITDVIDLDFSASYTPGSGRSVKADIEDVFHSAMQTAIDKYKTGDPVRDDLEFQAMKGNLEAALNMEEE